MKKKLKTVQRIFMGIVLLFLSLNFIPIKFAVNVESISHSKDTYVCEYHTATDGNWYASIANNPHLLEEMYLNIYNASDFLCLSEYIGVSRGEAILNKYIFYGKVEKKEISKGIFFNYLESSQWDIAYPIKRTSLRALITPPHYLNIYDFNFGEIVRFAIKNF